MKEIVLVFHILMGVIVVISSLLRFSRSEAKIELSKKAQLPSIVLVFFSGIGLVVIGSSLGRSCAGMLSLSLFVIAINSFTPSKTAS